LSGKEVAMLSSLSPLVARFVDTSNGRELDRFAARLARQPSSDKVRLPFLNAPA
jgi:hypothetical protein